jgi:hypothetical protein
MKKGSCSVDGTNAITLEFSKLSDNPIYLFARCGSNLAASLYAYCKCFGFKITKADGTLVMYLKPCKRDSDGAIGMLDSVSGQFFTNQGTGEDFIAGTKVEVHADLGAFLIFIESKWVFFILLIMPCFFILLYEIYLLIIAIKFDDEEDEVKEQVKTENTDSSDKLEDLARQLEELKKEAGEEEPKVKEENIDDLMAQLNSLRKEYDDIGSSNDKTEIIEIEKDEVQDAIEQSITEVIPVVTEKVIEQIPQYAGEFESHPGFRNRFVCNKRDQLYHHTDLHPLADHSGIRRGFGVQLVVFHRAGVCYHDVDQSGDFERRPL